MQQRNLFTELKELREKLNQNDVLINKDKLIPEMDSLLKKEYGLTLSSSLRHLLDAIYDPAKDIDAFIKKLQHTYYKVEMLQEEIESLEPYEWIQYEVFTTKLGKEYVGSKSVRNLEPDYLAYQCIKSLIDPPLDFFLYYFRFDNFDPDQEILSWEEQTFINLRELAYGASVAVYRNSLQLLNERHDLIKPNDQSNDTILQNKVREEVDILLRHLLKKWNSGLQILKQDDYDYVLNKACALVGTESIPVIEKKIEINAPAEFIISTFAHLCKSIHGKKIRPYWFEFVQTVFAQLNATATTTIRKKWSEKYMLEHLDVLKD